MSRLHSWEKLVPDITDDAKLGCTWASNQSYRGTRPVLFLANTLLIHLKPLGTAGSDFGLQVMPTVGLSLIARDPLCRTPPHGPEPCAQEGSPPLPSHRTEFGYGQM